MANGAFPSALLPFTKFDTKTFQYKRPLDAVEELCMHGLQRDNAKKKYPKFQGTLKERVMAKRREGKDADGSAPKLKSKPEPGPSRDW